MSNKQKNEAMKYLSGISFDHCALCGNTNGPWSLIKGRWVCEDCEEKHFKKREGKNVRVN